MITHLNLQSLLENLNTEAVTFNLEFYETYWYENDIRSGSLMNEVLPYEDFSNNAIQDDQKNVIRIIHLKLEAKTAK